MGKKDKKFIEDEVRAFSLQVKHNFITFTAFDLFELDWGLLIDVSIYIFGVPESNLIFASVFIRLTLNG